MPREGGPAQAELDEEREGGEEVLRDDEPDLAREEGEGRRQEVALDLLAVGALLLREVGRLPR